MAQLQEQAYENVEKKLLKIETQIIKLIQDHPPLLCAQCYAEAHLGRRTSANMAAVIVNGATACPEHLNIQGVPGRTPSGLHVAGK